MERQKCNIVWLKRDLRLRDHLPLQTAAADGLPTIICYFFEPSLIATPQSNQRHWQCVWQCLQDLQKQVQDFPFQIHVFHSEAIRGFELLSEAFDVRNIFSHQETGILHTFKRDKTVVKFCKHRGIIWREFTQDGVIRGLKHRRTWQRQVKSFLHQKIQPVQLDKIISPEISESLLQKLSPTPLPEFLEKKQVKLQVGGEILAWRYLNSFLEKRSKSYMTNISKPEASRSSTSRTSIYLAYGSLSVRQVYHKAERRKQLVEGKHKNMLGQFQSRCWWRCHFIQKLETEYQIEYEPFNKGFMMMSYADNEAHYEAWKNGQTGIPMIDANMRCLQATGFINFRMRAMLVSFATFGLRLHWKLISNHLAQLFLDFEPGIHYPQVQMQAGLTGYHTMRIYNPAYQSKKHDADGVFLRKWIPELDTVPIPLAFEPWRMTNLEQKMYNCHLGIHYPAPIVAHESVSAENKMRYWRFRQQPVVQDKIAGILAKHCVPKEQNFFRSSPG